MDQRTAGETVLAQPLQPLRVVQLSDFHLFADARSELLGVNTQDSLEAVLERVRHEQQNPDAILATGDLSQDGSPASYGRLEGLFADFRAPVYWVEGNHDKTRAMMDALHRQRERVSPCRVELGAWTLILLDSTIPDDVPGELFEDDFAFLQQALTRARGAHVLVALHHHPVAMGSPWLDQQQVRSAERLFRVVEGDPRVRALIWGHVHQEYEGERNGVRLFSVPSTCVQFKPRSQDFAVDDTSPGYRWFDLYPDGRIHSAVSRLPGDRFRVDPAATGY